MKYYGENFSYVLPVFEYPSFWGMSQIRDEFFMYPLSHYHLAEKQDQSPFFAGSAGNQFVLAHDKP